MSSTLFISFSTTGNVLQTKKMNKISKEKFRIVNEAATVFRSTLFDNGLPVTDLKVKHNTIGYKSGSVSVEVILDWKIYARHAKLLKKN